ERGQLLAEGGGVLGAQVDLIIGAADGEPHGLIGRAAIEIVLQRDGYLLGHRNLPDCPCDIPHRTQSASLAAAATPPYQLFQRERLELAGLREVGTNFDDSRDRYAVVTVAA